MYAITNTMRKYKSLETVNGYIKQKQNAAESVSLSFAKENKIARHGTLQLTLSYGSYVMSLKCELDEMFLP